MTGTTHFIEVYYNPLKAKEQSSDLTPIKKLRKALAFSDIIVGMKTIAIWKIKAKPHGNL